ncbi:Usherin [Lamellibrachia satsuma]|nr:Usherin [Lamellibrachia satsuma]
MVPGRSYKFSVLTIKHGVSSQPFGCGFRTQPLPPSNITISGKPEETFVTIIISPPLNTEFDGFNITWTNMDNNKTKSLVRNTSQQMEIVSNVTGLEAGHLYKLGVRTLSKNISSDQAWLCPSGQFLAKPSLPVTISVTVVNETALLVKWSQVHGQCTNIKIAYTADRDSARPDVMKQCNGSMAVLAELKSNLQYNIIFTTQRSKNNITSVSDVYARSIWTWSAEVTDLKHQPESPTSLQLSWMFPVLNAKEHLRHYVVEVLDPLTSECLYGVLLSNTQLSPVRNTTGCERGWKSGHFTGFDDVTYTLDSLDACANYSVKVFAVNMPGDAGVSNEITVTMPVGEPTSSVVINSTSSTVNSVYIEWLELKLEHSKCTVVAYEINYTYKNCSTDQPEEVIFNSTSMTSENITQLQPYWNYTFTVSAYTDAGKGGSVSEYVNVTTQEAVPGPPRWPNVTSRLHDTINIAWQPPTRCEMNGILTQYNVYYSFMDPLHHTLITRNVSVPSGQTRAMLTEAIHPFTIYSLTIHGMTIGQGEPSTTTPTRTAEWYPGVINSSSLTFETSPSSVVVSWDEPLSPNGVITNYTVCFKCHHVRIDMSCDHPNEQLTTNDSRTMMQVDGLRPYKRFEFRVKASTGVGAGNYSQPRYVMTDIGGLWYLGCHLHVMFCL